LSFAWSLLFFVDGFDADEAERIRQRVLAIIMSPPTGINLKGEFCWLLVCLPRLRYASHLQFAVLYQRLKNRAGSSS
jgi:hypothetical protein